MSFPELYRVKTDVGTYIPEDRLENLLTKLQNRIDKILAESRKGLETFEVTREDYTVTLSLARQITVTLPDGTTDKEMAKINKILKDEVMVAQIDVPASVLDQSQAEQHNLWFFAGATGGQPSESNKILVAQTFTPAVSGLLDKIDIYFVQGSPIGTINVSIQSTDELGKPTGDILTSKVIDISTILGDGFFTISFDVLVDLVAGVKYAIVINSGDVGNCFFGVAHTLSLVSSPEVDSYTRGEFLINYPDSWNTIKDSGIRSYENNGEFWPDIIYGALYYDMTFNSYML